ncbi:MAG: hypothetical protein EON53_09510 [Actinomycetales bacterium]|nr:MAG: hypothetical protein EON53_09510 [Actinomycetales bacterium]
MRDERGIATLEGIGTIVLAAVLVVGTVGAVEQRSGAVSSTVSWSVCTVTRGSDCGDRGEDPASSGSVKDGDTALVRDEDDNTTGYEVLPGLAPDQPLCLPTGDPGASTSQLPAGETKVVAKSSAPVGGLTDTPKLDLSAEAERSVTLLVDDPVLGPDGTRTQRVRLTLDAQLAMKGKQGTSRTGVEAKYAAGAKVSYAVTLPPDLASQTAWEVPPLPTDPSSLPVGGSLTIDGQTYQQLGLDASYQALKVSTENTLGSGTSTGITRVDENTVRVVVGPAEFIEESVVLGAGVKVGGVDVSAGWADKQTWKDTHLTTADFDISTTEGRAAYDAAVMEGSFPAKDGAGVSKVGTQAGLEWARREGWQVKAPNGTWGTVSTTEMDVLGVTRYADGTQVQSRNLRIGDKTYVAQETVDATGAVDPSRSTYTLALGAVSPEAATRWNWQYGDRDDLAVTEAQDMTVQLDHDDLERMRADALQVIAHGINTHPENDLASVPELSGGDATAADVAAYIESAKASGLGFDQIATQFSGLSTGGGDTYRLAYDVYAGDDHHVIALMHRYQGFGSDAAVNFLSDWNTSVAVSTGEEHVGYGRVSCRRT